MRRRLPDAAMGVALLAGGAAIGWFGRFWSFFYDEWGTILYRRSGGFSSFFAPHNGHLQATVIAVYRVLFATVGLRSYRPYLAVIIVAHLALVALVYAYARRRVGPWAAICAALPVLLLGHAWQVIFWAINLGFVFPLMALLAILLWRHPLVTGGGVALALASSGLGVAVAAGALVLALRGADRARRLVAWALPAGAYAAWWLAYRPSALPPASLRQIPGAASSGDVGSIPFPASNIPRLPGWVAHSAKAAAAALLGVGRSAGWWPLIGLVAVLVAAVVVRRRVSVAMIALAVTALVFWLETGMTRAQAGSPETTAFSRYLYPGALLLALLLVEAFAGARIPRAALGGVAIAIVPVLIADVHTLRTYGRDARVAFAEEARLLRRAQCDPQLPARLVLDRERAPQLTAGPYLRAVRALGSPPGQSCR